MLQWLAELPPEQAKGFATLTGEAKVKAIEAKFNADPKNAQKSPAAGAAPAQPAAGGTPAPAATPAPTAPKV
jgi:hypothetical protein